MSQTASAQSTLKANEQISPEALSDYIDAYVDDSWRLSIEDLVGKEAQKFRPIETPTPNFGFIDGKVWLRIALQNTTKDVDQWYLHTQENFLQYYEVYAVRDGQRIELLDKHTPETKFKDRQIQFPELVTSFDFQPAETLTLYIAYSSGGSSNISLSLETQSSYERKAFQQTSKNFVSYGMMLILIVTSLLALLILRLRVFLSYLTYVLVTLLFLMHSDGVAFQYFWPNHPGFNSNFSIIIGLAFAIVPYNFARVFLRTKLYHPRMDKVMRWIMIITPCVIIPAAFIDPQRTKQVLMLLVLMAIVIGTYAGFIASLTRFKEVRFYLFAWIFGVVSAGLMNLRHFTGLDIGQDLELDSIRVSIVVDAIMMGLGVADRYSQNMRAQRQADKERLDQANLNLALNTRLFDLEEQFNLATELVATRDKDIINTVHDLREPLHALRLNIQSLRESGNIDREETLGFEETFTYLETLIAGYLKTSVVKPAADLIGPQQTESDLEIGEILGAIYEMFLPDAKEKGLDFRYVKSSLSAEIDPLPLMRIVSNLVSNAIKYTPEGKILLGVRRRPNGFRIEVHDTGLGMTQTEFETAQKRHVRLHEDDETIKGHGYGLAIASELAENNDFRLFTLVGRKSGTSIALAVKKP